MEKRNGFNSYRMRLYLPGLTHTRAEPPSIDASRSGLTSERDRT